ncbi:polyprenyl synthetase family protein [Hoyosella altamirensis]|nr:polyprenyl synthetase family protein [Hoyosella altamirensis]
MMPPHLPSGLPQPPHDIRTNVADALRGFFRDRASLVEPVGTEFRSAVTHLEDFVLRGGKRVRPTFAWVGWLGAGGDVDAPGADNVLSACASLELIQACALIHDDIIDNSRTRRGFPTIHVEFARQHRDQGWGGDPESFGEAAGILIGDLALAWADDMFHGSGIGTEAHQRALPVWAAMRTEVLGGQLLDIVVESSGDGSHGSALKINRFKTAAYTVERPLHLGAAIAGADDALIAAYRTFGADIGIAFQLRDDLLGVFGDPATTGKPSGDDLRAGKRTALLAYALETADANQPDVAATLRSAVGTELSEADVDSLRSLIISLGAVERVEKQIADLTERALNALDASSARPGTKDALHAMALAVTRRTY